MWLNAGIDSGNIITTETVDICAAKSLGTAHQVVMDHAHELYLKAIEYIIKSNPPYQSIAQSSICKGNLYLTKMWTGEKKKQLLRNWDKRNLFKNTSAPVTVSLPKYE
jgi:methionyl-tRNA formyltransferase